MTQVPPANRSTVKFSYDGKQSNTYNVKTNPNITSLQSIVNRESSANKDIPTMIRTIESVSSKEVTLPSFLGAN